MNYPCAVPEPVHAMGTVLRVDALVRDFIKETFPGSHITNDYWHGVRWKLFAYFDYAPGVRLSLEFNVGDAWALRAGGATDLTLGVRAWLAQAGDLTERQQSDADALAADIAEQLGHYLDKHVVFTAPSLD